MSSFVSKHVSDASLKRPHPLPEALISLNEVMQQALQKIQTERQLLNQIILRCETLPLVAGQRQQLEELFDKLLSIIGSCPTMGTKLFLHVFTTCDLPKPADPKAEDFKQYTIHFYTNIQKGKELNDLHCHNIKECIHILEQHKGSLHVHDQQHSVRLFSVSLPGKIPYTCHP